MNSDGPGLVKIKRALISVSDKTGIVEFARSLANFGVEIISTGGTAKALRAAGIAVKDVSEVTGFPEMMDGRIKTLHPKIHGALLALRHNPEPLSAMNDHQIDPIDLVIVNLYPFEETIRQRNVTQAEAIEQIDIGGPALIRSAAKNWHDVAVVVLPADYAQLITELEENNGALSLATRTRLARNAFQQTAFYDVRIFAYLLRPGALNPEESSSDPCRGGSDIYEVFGGGSGSSSFIRQMVVEDIDSDSFSLETFHGTLPGSARWTLAKRSNLRYGENPHQIAGLYHTISVSGIANSEILSGKEMSYNNYVDADAAWHLVCDFDDLACAIIKHTNPAGVGLGATVEEAYRKALATDPVSAFGGIVAFNRPLDEAAANAVIEIFTEVVIAPDYDDTALDTLKTKKNLRVLRCKLIGGRARIEYRQISGGMLVQTADTHRLDLKPDDAQHLERAGLETVTQRAPTEAEIRALLFAWTVAKHTKSNAIVYARDEQTVGVGAGQMSRVDSVKIGAMRAQLPIEGSVLASDAFFPFRDGVDEAARYGITAIIQPGGSVRDAEVIAAANEHNLAMVFTGIRHFKH